MDFSARWYSPVNGRFTSRDTWPGVPYQPQTLNRYAYTLNNPLKYIDPTGHFAAVGGDPGGATVREMDREAAVTAAEEIPAAIPLQATRAAATQQAAAPPAETEGNTPPSDNNPGGGGSGGTDQPPITWQDRDNTYNSVAPAYSNDSGWNYENLSVRDDVDGVVFSDLPIGDDNAYGVFPKQPGELSSEDPEADSMSINLQDFKRRFGKLVDEVEQMLGLRTGSSGEPSSNGDGNSEGAGNAQKNKIDWPSKPHTNKTPGHWEAIVDKAEQLAQDPGVKKVYVNKGIGNEIPGIKPNNRPDILVLRSDGKLDQYDVPSKTDKIPDLIARMKLNQKLMGDRAGNIYILPPQN